MKIEEIEIKDLKPYKRNARRHSKEQIELLVKNIEKFGFTTPLLIDDNNEMIAGHGRLEAVKQIGKQDSLPCVRMKGLTESQIKALRLSDNRIAEKGEWEEDLLIDELKDLEVEDLELTGFEEDMLGEDESNKGKNKELEENDLGGFTHKCPKCGFEFNE